MVKLHKTMRSKRLRAIVLSITVILLTPITLLLMWLASFGQFPLLAVMQWGGITVCNVCTVCVGILCLGMSCVLHEERL